MVQKNRTGLLPIVQQTTLNLALDRNIFLLRFMRKKKVT